MRGARLILLSLAGLALLGLIGWRAAVFVIYGPGDEIRSLRWDGIDRVYRIHRPASLNTSGPVPLVLVLHGGGSNGRQTEFLTLNAWNLLAEREGFVVVYPDGVESRWNDGRTDTASRAWKQRVDDVGFLSVLIDQLSFEFHIDPKRVYATGISNGAMMSYRLACEASGKVAAIGPVAGAMPEPLMSSCSPPRPVSVVALSGVEDPLVLWNGGEIAIGRQRFGRVAPVPDSIQFWAERDGCTGSPAVAPEPDLDPGDGTRVTRVAYGPCRDGTEVALYAIEGGGHTWPGGFQYLPPLLIGRTSRDIDGAEVIWNFFKGRRVPEGGDGGQRS